jgi:dTDP-4-dehydrorhamnose reductase
MKILLFGKNGQLGWELQRALAPLGELIALDRNSVLTANLENLKGVTKTIRTVKPLSTLLHILLLITLKASVT